jgi:hypothetical protein
VIVNDLDQGRTIRFADERQPQLVIDPDTVLPLSVADKRLKMISWRHVA